MRRSTALLGFVSALCAAAALWTSLRLGAARDRITTLELLLARRDARAGSSSASAPAAASPATASAQSNTPPATPETPETPEKVSVLDQILQWQIQETEKRRDPAYREAEVAEQRREFASWNEDAKRVLGLNEAQWYRFVDLGARQHFGDERTDNAITHEDLQQLMSEREAELRALLGDEKLAKWREYQRTKQVRQEVDGWRIHAQLGPEPLSDSQFEDLVSTIYTERERMHDEYQNYRSAAGKIDPSESTPIDGQRYLDLTRAANQRIHDRAAATFSETQLSALDGALREYLRPFEEAVQRETSGKNAN